MDAVLAVSRLKTFNLHDSFKKTVRRLDYRCWLSQTTSQPFLQTVDLSLATGVRETYAEGLANVAPLIRMAF